MYFRTILIYVILSTFIASSCFAAHYELVPVELQVSVDFDDERDFRLIMPNGYERHFYWDENETHTDVTFSHTLYHNLNQDVYCDVPNTQVRQYDNITGSLSTAINTCSRVINSINRSDDCLFRLDNVTSRKNVVEANYLLCSGNEQTCKDDLQTCESDRDDYKDEEKSCQGQLATTQSEKANLDVCNNDLDDCKDSQEKAPFIWGAAGLGVGFFIWGRKKPAGPSEQAETGYVGGDQPRYRDVDETMPTFDDGPVE